MRTSGQVKLKPTAIQPARFESMQTYLVGGAVRDKYLNYPVVERDWVVVGARPDDLLNQGFKQVGKDFPVFLHPKTKEEYALARTERKSAAGYHGFVVNADSSVTLKDDLKRRDLTINAMALDANETLVDPYGGMADIKDRVLRHVSSAFVEDPLRVLRVARFAARYAHLGFTVAPETLALMANLAKSDEIKYLSAERVWKETQRALGEKSPQVYFQILQECGGLNYWFPEIACLWGIPNPERWHPEIDTFVHTMMTLEQCAQLSDSAETRFAALCHDLGKGLTPKEQWPSHRGHEKSGLGEIENLCQRIKAPKAYRNLAFLVSEFHLHLHRVAELKPKTILKVIEKTQAIKQPEKFEQFLIACEADHRGRTGYENRDYPQLTIMKLALAACQTVNSTDLLKAGFQGKQLGEKIRQARVKAIEIALNDAARKVDK